MDCGVKTVIGIDGSYVPRDRLHIQRNFFDCDLNSKIKVFEKKFELGICLEVAEHLPESRADTFIEEILLCSEAVLFQQRYRNKGTSHVNEQWQHYWVKNLINKGSSLNSISVRTFGIMLMLNFGIARIFLFFPKVDFKLH